MQYGTPWDTSGNKLERPSEERKSGDTTITGTDWAESSREQILCMPLYYGLRIAAAGNQLLLLRPGIAVKTAKPLAPKQAGAEAGLSKNKSKSGRAHEDSDRRQGPAHAGLMAAAAACNAAPARPTAGVHGHMYWAGAGTSAVGGSARVTSAATPRASGSGCGFAGCPTLNSNSSARVSCATTCCAVGTCTAHLRGAQTQLHCGRPSAGSGSLLLQRGSL